MPVPVLSRVQLFAPLDGAAQIARLIAAILEAEPVIRPMIWLDSVETCRYDFVSGGVSVEIMVDDRERVPRFLQFDTTELEAALERVLAAGFSARAWPPEDEILDVVVEIGDLTVAVSRRSGTE